MPNNTITTTQNYGASSCISFYCKRESKAAAIKSVLTMPACKMQCLVHIAKVSNDHILKTQELFPMYACSNIFVNKKMFQDQFKWSVVLKYQTKLISRLKTFQFKIGCWTPPGTRTQNKTLFVRWKRCLCIFITPNKNTNTCQKASIYLLCKASKLIRITKINTRQRTR